MKGVNNVHLDGFVAACSVLSQREGLTVAKLRVVTLSRRKGAPKDAPLSERTERMAHVVRLTATGSLAGRVAALPSTLRLEGEPGFVTCRLDGRLRTEDSFGFVECSSDGFQFTRQLQTAGGNRVDVRGELVSMSYSDRQASVTVDTGEGSVTSHISRAALPEAWDAVANGLWRKGETLELQGPLVSRTFTDGERERLSCMVGCTAAANLSLAKARKEDRKGQVTF